MASGFGCSASKVTYSHAIWISYIFDSAISLDTAKRCLEGSIGKSVFTLRIVIHNVRAWFRWCAPTCPMILVLKKNNLVT
ncbi:hypothetical protein K1719_011913 [Acacia pycnantha]|nr:hypothetical protein K1719_011913 [Acacia pycnantha]